MYTFNPMSSKISRMLVIFSAMQSVWFVIMLSSRILFWAGNSLDKDTSRGIRYATAGVVITAEGIIYCIYMPRYREGFLLCDASIFLMDGI
jgi:hypothetical protein